MATQEDVDRLLDLYGPEELHADLSRYVFTDPSLGQVLKHPLVFHVPFFDGMNRLANRQYAAKSERIARLLEEKQYSHIMWMYERPYRLQALMEHEEAMRRHDEAGFWITFSALWRDNEFPYESFDEWRAFWEEPGSRAAMSLEERAELTRMDERFTIYRGGTAVNATTGMSWTIDREKAVWFAQRWSDRRDPPVLATGTIRREDVRAYLIGRNESEIVALPETVQGVTTQRLPRRLR